jgi:hypothetical protein
MGKKKKEKNKPTKQKNIDLSKNGVGNDSTPQIRYDRKGRRKYTFKEKVNNLFSLYDELIFCKLANRDSKNCRYINPEQGKIGVDFLGTYDKDNIAFYYTVSKLPQEIYIDWKERLRSECKTGVRLTFVNNIRRHSIAWESPQMQSRLRILKQVRDEEDNKDINAYNMHRNINDLNKQKWIEESLLYLSDADKQRGRGLFKTTQLMIISGKRGEDFDDSVKLIEEYAKHIGLGLNRLMYELPDILEYYSPFNHNLNRNVVDTAPSYVLPDEILSRFNTYTQGTLGVSGVYFGTDVYSKFPVLKRVKPKEDTAENWLITAETGGGKSFFVKALLLQLLAQGYNGTIMDIEGFEYIPMANYLSHNSTVQIINMGEGNGKYFDPMEIAKPTGLEDIDRDAKQMSINFTLSVFKVLLGRTYEENLIMSTVLDDAVTEVYKDAGVTEDSSTWGNSRDLTLFHVYAKLYDIERFRDDEDYMKAVKLAIAVLSKYFDEDGTRSAMFRDRIRVAEIINADLVICSFGMAGKSPQSIDEVQLALMQLSAAQLSHQRSIFSKSCGKFNFKLWEEFQRWGKFPDSDKTLGVALTGGRKLGDVNIIITNVVKELLDDDRFGIFGNITSFLAGAIGDEKVRTEFCDRLSVPKMKPEMDLLASAKKNDEELDGRSSSESLYSHAFLCGLDRSKYGIVKMLIPPDIARSLIFKTGVDLKKKEEYVEIDEDY